MADLRFGTYLAPDMLDVYQAITDRVGEVLECSTELVVEAGLHEAAIRLVAEGEVDASAIDSQVLEVELRDHPELAARLRVLEALGPSTIQPVAVSRRIDPALRSRIQDALVSMHLDPATGRALARGVIDRFVAVGPQSYDDVRRMVEACERAGYLELR